MIVVDLSALIAISLHEVERGRFIEAMDGVDRIEISSGTLIEARMVAYNKGGAELVDRLDRLLAAFDAQIVPTDLEQADIAQAAFVAFGKGSGHPAGLNFGDLFSYALAKARGAPLLFKGDDFVHTDVADAGMMERE